MDIFTVKVKYQIYDALNETTTISTIEINRKAKDQGEANTMVAALFNALSNVVYEIPSQQEGNPPTKIPYIIVLAVGQPAFVS